MYEYRPSISLNERHYTKLDGLNIGTSISGTAVRIPVTDIQGHLLITGKTGSGKSSLVAEIMRGLSATDGCNIMLIDPHGKLAEDFVVSNRSKELVYISPRTVDAKGQKSQSSSTGSLAVTGRTRKIALGGSGNYFQGSQHCQTIRGVRGLRSYSGHFFLKWSDSGRIQIFPT